MCDEGRYVLDRSGQHTLPGAVRERSILATCRSGGLRRRRQSRHAGEFSGVSSTVRSGSDLSVSAMGTAQGESPWPMTTQTMGTRIPSRRSGEPGHLPLVPDSIGTRLPIQALLRSTLVHLVGSLLVCLCDQCTKTVFPPIW